MQQERARQDLWQSNERVAWKNGKITVQKPTTNTLKVEATINFEIKYKACMPPFSFDRKDEQHICRIIEDNAGKSQ